MMTGTSILESCIILAIRDMRKQASIRVDSVIDLIEGAHQAGYINKLKRGRLIDEAHDAERFQVMRLNQAQQIMRAAR